MNLVFFDLIASKMHFHCVEVTESTEISILLNSSVKNNFLNTIGTKELKGCYRSSPTPRPGKVL
jgi:hypothetical protein